jgi:putative membrane protein
MKHFGTIPVAAAALACALSAQAQQVPSREQAHQDLQQAQQQLQQAQQNLQNAMRRLQAAEGQPAQPGSTVQMTQAAERQFAERAWALGQLEIQASELALQRSRNEQVRQLAQHLLQDQRDASGRLQEIASASGVPLSPQLPAEQQQKLQRLQQLQGHAFDLQFVQTVGVQAHRDALQWFQDRAVAQGGDPALREFARERLPLVQQHLHLAHSAHAQMAPRDVTEVLGAGRQGQQPMLAPLPPGATEAQPRDPTAAAAAVPGPDRRDPVTYGK